MPEDQLIAQYNAVRNSQAWQNRSRRGKLVITGRDRSTWLQGMISNDINLLSDKRRVMQACLLNVTGHVIADLMVVDRGDSYLLEFHIDLLERVYRFLERYIIEEHVEIVDQSVFLSCISLQGPQADAKTLQLDADLPEDIIAADHTGSGGYDIFLRSSELERLIVQLAAKGILEFGMAAEEVLRVEAGIPAYGLELDENVLPHECGLEMTHISFTKGCYLGQEIVARIQTRGHTNRGLSGLLLEGDVLPAAGSNISQCIGVNSREIGCITSSVWSPARSQAIALGLLRHESREPGTAVVINSEHGDIRAKVAILPFIKT